MEDNFYLVTGPEWLLVLFTAALLLSAGAAWLLARRRPGWGLLRRTLVAAGLGPALLALPVFGLIVTLFAARDEGWNDVARAAVFALGLQACVILFLFGLPAAWLTGRAVNGRSR